MSELLLFANTASFDRSVAGTISGVFAIQVSDEFVPSADWNDLPIVLAADWLEALLRLARTESRIERVQFLDGPFWADLARSGDCLSVELVESKLKGNVSKLQITGSFEHVLSNAVSTAAQIYHECRVRGWEDSDLMKLEKVKQEGRKLLRGATGGGSFPESSPRLESG